jgi:bifunctional UDP-N-acetylglucosamine pyrophosphorylase/glucosamine-1-phosphate N-acetyltransferase
LQAALPFIVGKKILVLLGDVPLLSEATLQAMLRQSTPQSVVLLTEHKAEPFGYGRIKRQNGRVIGIVEEKDASPEEKNIAEVNTGIMLLPKAPLQQWLTALRADNVQQEYYLTDIIGLAAQNNFHIITVSPKDPWEASGVNNPYDLKRLDRHLQRQKIIEYAKNGLGVANPESITIEGEIQFGEDVTIGEGCVFAGQVILEDDVCIEPYAILRDCTIGKGTRIRSYTMIEGAIVGENSVIGPYARLRPETVLERDVHIGNFVEVKKSHMGEGSKANHLSYLGDAIIGKRVNIGAGTITCNYDGIHKHQTTIHDGAFIGSNTALVAPVVIGQQAVIGAGSVITENAPPDTLTLARAKQTTIPHWQRKKK